MKRITLYASWENSGYGYIIGNIRVEDEKGNVLMDDTDMYYDYLKFYEKTVVQKFRYNSRFEWIKATYYRDIQRLDVIMNDKGRGSQ